MLELLSKYSMTEIAIIIVLLAVAVKECVSFYDWAKERLKKSFKKNDPAEKVHQDLSKEVNKNKERVEILTQNQEEMKEQLNNLTNLVQLLISSDKDNIKSWITQQHHYFCYQKKCIDDYSLDCVEKRYSHYIEEHGNSFVADLMEDIRNLPIENELNQER